MSLDKAIKSGREKRKAYRRAKAIDHSCRNHGSCPYCRSNRLHARRRAEEAAGQELEAALGDKWAQELTQ